MEYLIEPTNKSTFEIPNRIIEYKFGEYNISVILNAENEFVGINEIGIDKTFYSYNSVKDGFDARKYYEE